VTVPRYRGKSWLRPGGAIQPWIDALWAIDHNGDKAPLIELLKSNKPVPEDAMFLVGDLLARYQLIRPPGGLTTPAYDRSRTEMWLIWAAASVRKHIKDGMTPDEAIKLAADTYGVTEGTLRVYLAGKYGSAQRMKKRRPAIRPIQSDK
jgi:hypothetical protein